MQLDATTLHDLGPEVSTPGYDRSAVRTGIVHLGVGGFHRSHQAMYLDRLMNQGQALEWGICGVGVLPSDARMRDVLTAQDGLYTLVLAHPDGFLEARVIGSMVEYLLAPDDPEAVLEKMADPQVRIVSLTVTEGGYNTTGIGAFDTTEPGVVADAGPGAVPRTVFGLVVEALARRRQRGVPPFTVVSCDNMPGNGDVAADSFTAFARLRDPELGDWVQATVRFPNSMVDRITPGTTDVQREEVSRRFAVEDGWPVIAETYTQWVLQDDFSLGRPPLEDAGVQVVADVEPYELMKLRLLNASHQCLGYLGLLAGYTFMHDACQDPFLRAFLVGYMTDEATPSLPPVPGIDLAQYRADLLGRFSNPYVRDTLARLCVDSSERIPRFLLPVVRDALAAGRDVTHAAVVVAAWARWAAGTDDSGRELEMTDPRADALRAAARSQDGDPLAFLRLRELFGDLVDDERFTGPYRRALVSLTDQGARATVQAVVRGTLV
ncbi:mannitol dehydrogenase family protein [Modestobacter sp. VKM Ac-2986]|uniref:mannitol dehydrogenase family protein n=1 Tax=Modestobacter sp. VKM Ac-2986 TaxID=3004140 RepID=UPI0022AB862A|nr:mannitol dehydrogenase family protein [Modestobacter sp. VKM Ac-2986]MCZ2829241.1 mannitol dehydrogenase family protein [Modestobacter sp. VKM Ac-2986]